jgi:hypothetical protein
MQNYDQASARMFKNNCFKMLGDLKNSGFAQMPGEKVG